MKSIAGILLGSMLLVTFGGRSEAAPPNDNFVDRIVLSGNSVTFDGNLVGATREWAGQQSEVFSEPGPAYGTVWWSWTAEQSVPVTLTVKRLNAAPKMAEFSGSTPDYLAVFR